MHLPPKQDLVLKASVILLVGAVAFAGASRIRPDAPLRVEPLTQKQTVATNLSPPTEPATPVVPANKIVVDVAGEVVHRGTVTLSEDARAEDAIKAAGGMKPTADVDAVNLAAKLADGDQVYVPPKNRAKSSSTKTIRGSKRTRSTKVKLPKATLAEKVSAKPTTLKPAGSDIVYVDLRPDENAGLPPFPDGKTHEPVRNGPRDAAPSAKTSDKVDLNRCQESDLLTVPGIGPSTARKIIAYRNLKGRILSIDDLLQIPGIGPKKLEKMRPYFRL